MGPLLLHNKNIIIVDGTLREVAKKRYEKEIREAHKLLHDFFEKQPNSYVDKKYRRCVLLDANSFTLIGNVFIFYF